MNYKTILLMLLLAPAAALADPKTDLLSFKPGDTVASVESRIAKLKCQPDGCNIEGGKIRFSKTDNLEPNVIASVTYSFQSGLAPEEMVGFVSGQFSREPTTLSKAHLKANIKKANQGRPVEIELPFYKRTSVAYGGDIASWDISKTGGLTLSMGRQAGSTEYILRLVDERFNRLDAAALEKQRADKEQIARSSTNRAPRF